MKYTPHFFYDSMPDWKKKKDPIVVRLFYRPISYVLASVCANMGITANAVSYFSILVGAAGGLMFLFGTQECGLAGAILINLWITLDAVDGNLARGVQKQPFGEFADAIAGYITTAFACLGIGYGAFRLGGILFPENSYLMILLGGFAAFSDPLMRLVFQKYKATERKMLDEGVKLRVGDNHGDINQVTSLKTRVEERLGIGGILPLLILLGVVFHALDLVVLYCTMYYGGACVAMICLYIRKAIKNEKNS